MIRALLTLVVFGSLVYCGATVKLGQRTFFGHIANIWRAKETQEMVDGVKEKSGPTMKKVKRGVEAGWEKMSSDEALDAGAP